MTPPIAQIGPSALPPLLPLPPSAKGGISTSAVRENERFCVCGAQLGMNSECSTSNLNDISIMFTENGADFVTFHGAVECSQGGGTQSSSMTGTTQDEHRDGDGDGVPDSSDRCLNNLNPRCFKEEAK